MNEKGFCAGGSFNTTKTYEAKRQMGVTPEGQEVEELVICDKWRDETGHIRGLIYRVSDYRKVFKQEEIYRPDPAKPDEFLIGNEELREMILDGKLISQVYLRPEAIDVRNNHIHALRFHSGLVLSPHETGHYAYEYRALLVLGYQLIRRKHKLEFFYRAKPDGRSYNNLRALPREKLDL
jgi:hypothetical protein